MSKVKSQKSKVEGSILPFAVIMTGMILLAAIAIGSVVLSGVKRAKDTDSSVGAYALADSGVERQLFEIRKNNRTLADVNTLGATYPDGSSWVSTGSLEPATQKIIPIIPTSTFAVLDLFNPDDITEKPGIAKVTIEWTNHPSCAGSNAAIEASYASWDLASGGPPPTWPDSNQYTIESKTGGGTLLVNLDVDRAYRLRLRAFTCAASNVKVTTYDLLGSAKSYKGDITLSAEGTYGGTTQKIAVKMPKQDVLSGIFSYVIFSECTLYKDEAGGSGGC